MKYWIVLFFCTALMAGCNSKSKKEEPTFYVDQNWIEAHITRTMSTKDLVDIRDRLIQFGVGVNYKTIQRDSAKRIILLEMEVSDGKGKFARTRTEFLDNITYGIRIHRGDISDEGFKAGPLYTRRPE